MQGGLPLGSRANTVMCLAVSRKRPHRQVLSTVWELYPQPLTGPLLEALSHHPSLVGRPRLCSDHAADAADHPNYIPKICTEPHLVEQTDGGVEHPL